MFELEIIHVSGETVRHKLPPGSYRLGKGKACEIRLEDTHVSRHHANVTVSDGGGAILEDAGSTNGVWFGERQITSHAMASGDIIRIGQLQIRASGPRLDASPPIDEATVNAMRNPPARSRNYHTTPPPRRSEPSRAEKELQSLKSHLHEKVLKYLDMHKRGVLHKLSADELRSEARTAAQAVMQEERVRTPAGVAPAAFVEEIVAEAIGLGPIEVFMADETITEVMVNGHEHIYVERRGRIELTNVRFSSESSLRSVIERIVSPLGRRVDEGSPMVDARLADGSRVNAIIPPLALNGSTLTIRKFSKDRLTIDDLIDKGTLSEDMAQFLKVCVQQRKNIIVSGGTGSGKTTTLNILSNFIPAEDRIVTIEDAAELQLDQEHVVSLESRPPNVEGKGQVAIRDLVRNSLRMRPDRIVIGECRGGEALDMLQAMNTGHDGSLTTGHANSPRDLLSRLEVMVLMAGYDLPVRAVREQVASAVDIIIQQTRLSDGSRRITGIVEVDGMEGDVVLMQNVFKFEVSGRDADGTILGQFQGCGYAPSFYRELERAGVEVDRSIFGALQGQG